MHDIGNENDHKDKLVYVSLLDMLNRFFSDVDVHDKYKEFDKFRFVFGVFFYGKIFVHVNTKQFHLIYKYNDDGMQYIPKYWELLVFLFLEIP
jgi:hypothetical protein